MARALHDQLLRKDFTVKMTIAFLRTGSGLLVCRFRWHSRLSLQSFLEVNDGLSLAMIPMFSTSDQAREICYVMDHYDIDSSSNSPNSSRQARQSKWKPSRSPLATWIKQSGAFPSDPERPVIILFGGDQTETLTKKIVDHYLFNNSYRWERLHACLPWIFIDTFNILTNWDSILQRARLDLEDKEHDMFDRESTNSIFQQTFDLHRDASITLALQEGLRMHQAALKRFKHGLTLSYPLSIEMKAGFETRMDYIAELLNFYGSTCDTIMQQQKNLLSLAFNLETVIQSQAVARLNILAMIFLPISFIASIFGITTITVPAFWYPVAALPTLLITCAIAFMLSRSTVSKTETPSRNAVEEAHLFQWPVRMVIESLPSRPEWPERTL
ncbi:hypothetical protein F5Y16DRAFT_382933 [Xylariaceae sp. FL0255]|nr:hypothetical protein F5Y16DRAFT_382933 [Xylariaceae sp. FL0255]